jgi:hypothetical protein
MVSKSVKSTEGQKTTTKKKLGSKFSLSIRHGIDYAVIGNGWVAIFIHFYSVNTDAWLSGSLGWAYPRLLECFVGLHIRYSAVEW